jgi:hypothetical protein
VTLNARLVALFDLPLAAIAGWLLWRSLGWPLVGDATIFHFIGNQVLLGEIPYRDIFDINMPLVYGLHAALVLAGGTGDLAWRIFDLSALALMVLCVCGLLRPAGWPAAILAAAMILTVHLLLGAYSAGQRDFLMAIAAVATAWGAASVAENPGPRRAVLFAVGACAMAAASIKPTGILLLAFPVVTIGHLKLRDLMWTAGGALSVALAVFGTLALMGGFPAFVAMLFDLLPRYAAISDPPLLAAFAPLPLLLPLAALAFAAAMSLSRLPTPRLRAMMAITLFGMIHLIAQRKGFFYHIYPLAAGLACWGSWQLARLPAGWALIFLAATLLISVSSARKEAVDPPFTELRAAADMQAALESHLPRGSRVQTLDSDRGAFLAMARADMRQATPHIQWFSLITADRDERERFLTSLAADPPAGMLLTNDHWPTGEGFDTVDGWPQFKALLALGYDLSTTGTQDYIAWRLYLRRAATPEGVIQQRLMRRSPPSKLAWHRQWRHQFAPIALRP